MCTLGEISPFLKNRTLISMVNLHYQLDWVLNHLGDVALDLCVRVFLPVSFNWGQRAYLEHGQHPPMGWSPGVNEREKRRKTQLNGSIHFSSSWPQRQWDQPPHASIAYPPQRTVSSNYESKWTPPALKCSCQVPFFIATRNVTNVLTIIAWTYWRLKVMAVNHCLIS